MNIELIGLSETEETDVIFTPWSLAHLAAGSAAKELGIPFWYWEAIHGAYEFKDFIVNEHGDILNSFANSAGDQIATSLGHYFASGKTGYTMTFLYLASWAALTAMGDSVG